MFNTKFQALFPFIPLMFNKMFSGDKTATQHTSFFSNTSHYAGSRKQAVELSMNVPDKI
jgi:hypothetical protein